MLKVHLKKTVDDSYPVIIESGLLKRLPRLLANQFPASRYVVMCGTTTKKLFGEKISSHLRTSGMKTLLLSVPDGEHSKTQKYKTFLEEAMLQAGCDRNTLILAVGGGVVGDLAGFVAATYMRGIRYIQIPTTLLAMVDSSVGGKTAIDTAHGKNTIGAFWQPQAVVIDPTCLKKLSLRQMKNGMIEGVKMFMTSDRASFVFAEKNLERALSGDAASLKTIIERAIRIKARVVAEDEREGSQRMILNFGHTVGHALETLSGYRLLHGEAIALGIAVEARIAYSRGILSETDLKKVLAMLRRLGTEPKTLKKWNAHSVVQHTRGDKKSVGGRAQYVLLKKIGAVQMDKKKYAHTVPEKEVISALRKAALGV